MREDSFKAVDGLNIFFRSWSPTGKTRAVLVIVHGFNSHSGQYLWAAEQFAAQGFAVYALDQRGRGKSEGRRFYVEKVEDYVDDVTSFVKLAKVREPTLPVFVLGHSAGGVISCVYALGRQSEIAGLICESFALEVPAPAAVAGNGQGAGTHRAAPAGVQAPEDRLFARPECRRFDDPRSAHCE